MCGYDPITHPNILIDSIFNMTWMDLSRYGEENGVWNIEATIVRHDFVKICSWF